MLKGHAELYVVRKGDKMCVCVCKRKEERKRSEMGRRGWEEEKEMG